MKKLILFFLKVFCYITTAVFIIVSLGFSFYGADPTVQTLRGILLCSFLSALSTVITYGIKPEDMNILLSTVIHYIFLCVIMGVIGYLYHWIAPNFAGIGSMCLYVAAVYAFTFTMSWLSDRENAKNINRALEEKYSENR